MASWSEPTLVAVAPAAAEPVEQHSDCWDIKTYVTVSTLHQFTDTPPKNVKSLQEPKYHQKCPWNMESYCIALLN